MANSSAIILFEGGLDMVSPVQDSYAGTLVDCLNYEVGPIKGYKRIDGFERFDNFPGGGVSNLYRTTLVINGRDVEEGTYVYSTNRQLLGVVVEVLDVSTGECLYVPSRPGASLMPGKEYLAGTLYEFLAPAEAIVASEDWREVAEGPDEYIQQLLEASDELRGLVRTAPRPVAGVFYGGTEAYAAVDCIEMDISNASPSLSVGQFVAYDGEYGRILEVNDGVAQIHPIRAGEGLPSGFFTATYADLYNNTVGAPITGAVPNPDTGYRGSLCAGLYRLISADEGAHSVRGYTPMATGLVIRFEGASAPFDDLLILDNGEQQSNVYVESYTIESGDFENEDASGILYLTFPTSGTIGWDGTLDSSYAITYGGNTAEIAEVLVPCLAGTGRLRGTEAGTGAYSHYVWGTYNFLSAEGLELTFVATGKSRAGFISSRGDIPYWGNIVSSPDPELDMPKYLTFHAGQRLVLGSAEGSIRLSSINSPLNFSGLDGAIEIGNGDRVTGLLEAAGDSTAVFGARSIRRIVGKGADLSLSTITSAAGAYDYTAATVSGSILYVNQNGVCSLDQTSAYGDFSNSAVSGAVDPWLTPRVVQDASSFELGGTVCAFPVRDKNQYRLFLGDGNVLNLSITPEGGQITISNYALVQGSLRVPLAWGSSVSNRGEEFVLVVWDRVRAEEGVRGLVEDLPADNIIYRLDHGWGFDGKSFPHYIETAYLFNEEPNFFSITKAVLYGMGYGSSTLRLRASGIEDAFDQPFDITVQDISLPRNPEILYRTLGRVLGIVDHSNWGRGIKLRFENITPAGSFRTEPHHILQSVRLFLNTEGVNE